MAGNAKTRAKKVASEKKGEVWTAKFRRDIDKIFSTGETPKHFVPRGQAFTQGKKS